MWKRFQRKRTMKNNALIWICLFISILILSIVYINNNYSDAIRDWLNNVSKTDTVISTRIDTMWMDTVITEREIVPREVYVTRIDTFYTKDGKDTVIKTENKLYKDTLCYQKDSIILKSYISGVNPNLDSISADWRKSETTITNTVEITKYIEKPKRFIDRFHIQPQVGVGYGIINKDFDAYVGIGIGVDI